MAQLHDYKTFEDPAIWVHVVYDVKHYMCHKVRLVAGGDMDEVPKDITASVSSLHGMQF